MWYYNRCRFCFLKLVTLAGVFLFYFGFAPTIQGSPVVTPQQLLFTHISTADGLSYNTVNCVFKDSRGFIWIGTQEGLNRYDAADIKVYRHSVSFNGIAGNDVKAIT